MAYNLSLCTELMIIIKCMNWTLLQEIYISGYYCRACFEDLNNICIVCNKMILFEDENVSEEQYVVLFYSESLFFAEFNKNFGDLMN